jgi:hypothetical protein
MAVSMFALPLSASAAGGTNYYYVENPLSGQWVAAPMGQDTVKDVTDNGDGTFTIELGYGYYTSTIYQAELIGKVVAFEGTAWDQIPFEIDPVAVDGGSVTFDWDPVKDPAYIEVFPLTIDFTYADDPDWDNPVMHVPLSTVRFYPNGGPSVS